MRAVVLLALCALGDEHEGCVEDCISCARIDWLKEIKWMCLACRDGTELWLNGCYEPCPAQQYRNGPNCEPCGANCDFCTGPLPHECLQCSEGFEFDFRMLCAAVCPQGQYPAGALMDNCEDCDSSCRNCIASWKSSCTECTDKEYALKVLDERTGSGECLKRCDPGYFRESPGDLRCIQCQHHCMKCLDRYECDRDACADRPIPAQIQTGGVMTDVTSENWVTCHNTTYCVHPRTDCCEDNYDYWRGMCYQKPGPAAEAIDFQSYLASGAGIVWDPDTAPEFDRSLLR
jgi:hypothetical protein